MESKITEMQKTIDALEKANSELLAWQQEYNSQKQSFMRMSTRLRKLCKKLTPTTEIVAEMQELSKEIKDLARLTTRAN